MSTCAQHFEYRDEELLRLCAELDRLNFSKDGAMAAYIAHVQAQRGLTGPELQRALARTAEAQEAFERCNALAYEKERELDARKQALLAREIV